MSICSNVQNCNFRISIKLSSFANHNTAKIVNKGMHYWAGINKYFKLAPAIQLAEVGTRGTTKYEQRTE